MPYPNTNEIMFISLPQKLIKDKCDQRKIGMITGSLKNKINSIWQDFYNENMAQTSEIVNQLTTLMFIKMLDDKQNAVEAQAAKLQIAPRDSELTFKRGIYKYIESDNDRERVVFEIPYEDLRWKNFKNLNGKELANRIKELRDSIHQRP